jgi:two-component system sensor histidine kinase/response regulator
MPAPSPNNYETQVLARFEGDRDLLGEIVRLFLEDCPQTLEAVRAAVVARNGEAIYRTAHTLKGSVSNFLSAKGMEDEDDPARDAARAFLALEQLGAGGQLEKVDDVFAAAETVLLQLRQRLEQIIAS